MQKDVYSFSELGIEGFIRNHQSMVLSLFCFHNSNCEWNLNDWKVSHASYELFSASIIVHLCMPFFLHSSWKIYLHNTFQLRAKITISHFYENQILELAFFISFDTIMGFKWMFVLLLEIISTSVSSRFVENEYSKENFQESHAIRSIQVCLHHLHPHSLSLLDRKINY